MAQILGDQEDNILEGSIENDEDIGCEKERIF